MAGVAQALGLGKHLGADCIVGFAFAIATVATPTAARLRPLNDGLGQVEFFDFFLGQITANSSPTRQHEAVTVQ